MKEKSKKVNKILNFEDRQKIEQMLHSNMKHKDICTFVGINPSTLYREMKKCKGSYSAQESQENTFRRYNLIDWEIIGKKFGLLTVIEYANIYKKRTWWKCKCDCGAICIMSRKVLTEYCSPKRPLSCGCVPKEHAGPKKKLPIEESMLRKYKDLLCFRQIKGECWEWTGYKQNGKTPKTSWKNKAMSVRKCMYLLVNGTTFEPNPVFTTCGNLNCFNPNHITLNRPTQRQYYE